MTIQEIGAAANQLTPAQKVVFLARLAHELTVEARDTYVAGTDDVADPRRLRVFNEIQHRVVSCLLELLQHPANDIWIWPAISEWAEGANAVPMVCNACRRVLVSIRADSIV